MGKIALGSGGDAARHQGHPGRPSEPRPDLAGGGRARSADRPSQLYLDPALLARLSGFVGQNLARPHGRASQGSDALCRFGRRRRYIRRLAGREFTDRNQFRIRYTAQTVQTKDHVGAAVAREINQKKRRPEQTSSIQNRCA